MRADAVRQRQQSRRAKQCSCTAAGRKRRPAVETLESRMLLAAISEQIIVDQFGWRASAPRKVVIFADPVTGQNSAISYTPGASFQVRRVSDNATVFTGNITSWNNGATQSTSGDKVWYGDFSSVVAPGDYYIYDPTNNLQSYNFRLDDSIYSPVLTTSVRTFYYQRCGTDIPAEFGGNWVHDDCHVGANQDLAAFQWLNGASTGTARDVHGGWHDAGDMNKYVPFTTGVLWDLMQAYEWNTAAFADNWNIPESGNSVPDILDEVKYELDWILRMQMPNGSVANRVAVRQYAASSPPESETLARYYTQPTSWATASAAASFAHAARLFASFSTQYPGYSASLLTAAQNAWTWLNSNSTMTPSTGNDGGGSGGGSGGLAAAGADCNANADKRLRVLAAAELFKTTGNTAYRTYFDTWVKDPSTFDGTHNPLVNNWFDSTQSSEINRACVTYATTPGATASLVNEIKSDLANSLNSYLNNYTTGADAYRAFMYDGHYCWGSNQIKAQWGNLFIYGIKLDVSSANAAGYREAAEEYLHYFHGRNPLSWVYLSNMGTKCANLGAEKSSMEFYHGWFADGSALYDGPSSTYGPAPGFLVGGPNQYYSGAPTPPKGEPPMKAYRDWNTAWPDSSWEVTENAIYYQAAYTLLASQFAGASVAQAAAPSFSPAPGTYPAAQNVTITTATPGATIRYTIDGSIPTSTYGTVYSGPVPVSSSLTLKAIAYASGMADSSITTGVYAIGALPAIYIYQDGLVPDWDNWSWGTTVNFANTSPVHGGTNSISATITSAWSGLSLRKGTAIDTVGYSSLKFWVHGGTGSNKNFRFYSQSGDTTGESTSYYFTAIPNTWTEITIPLSSLGNPAQIKRITFQDNTGAPQSAVYFDDIRLHADVVNQAPTDITLSATTIAENQPSGTTVGSFSTTDPDTGDTFTYTLVTGAGSTDNSSFTIIGNQLRTAAPFNYEAKSSYSIRVRSTDAGGLFFEKVLAIGVIDLNETPTDISLSSATVAENQLAGTAVGAFSTADPDAANTFAYSLVSGNGSADNASFAIVGNQLRTAAIFDYETKSSYSIRVRTTDQGGLWYEEAFAISITNLRDATIAGRRVFYNRSTFDGNNPAATVQDDAAIATDKQALLPGQTATFANYSSYSRGLNGIMLDLSGLTNTLTASDLFLKVGNSNTPGTWATAPAPTSITQRALAGGITRVTLLWADNAIQKQWLQITVLANANTDLAANDVFYFGNAIGECGNVSTNAQVTTADEALTRNNQSGLATVPITSWYDYNRDGRVNSQDLAITRANKSGLSPLLLITPASGGGAELRPAGSNDLLQAPPAPRLQSLTTWAQTLLYPEEPLLD